MKIATLLFTFNRSVHTEKVVNSLRQNTVLPEKLIIFQDGLKQGCENDVCEWTKVNNLIYSIDWCSTEVIVSNYNRGLADSIISGINYAFKEYDAVIVLEDDCVAAPDFIKFMKQCFEKYEQNKSVYCISGYHWPILLKESKYDVYGCGRISSWGWGTWKDRWEKYDTDCDLIKRLKRERVKSRNLAMWGSDCEKMFLDKMVGINDSWAVYWALIVIENEGLCINPYDSLIQNIGMDNTGVHCGKTDKFQVALSNHRKKEFKLPDDLIILHSTKKAFAGLYGNYTSVNIESGSKEKILIYGLGDFFLQNEKSINEIYYIEGFVDKNKSGYYAGKKIIHMHEIEQQNYNKILIMIQNIQECLNIIRELITKGISAEKIFLGHNFYGIYSQCIDKILVLPEGALSVTVGQVTVKVRSMDEFNNVYEVLVDQTYNYYINNDKKDIVIDVGMNVGDAALYFLNSEKVKKVYAYEPFRETFLAAKDNLEKYLHCPERIEIFQYGISNENSKRVIGFDGNMSCGQSTIDEVREKVYGIYQSWGLVQDKNDKKELIEVRDAVEVILPIIQKHSDCNIIIKMDCEGEEYGIIDKLFNESVLSCISFIILEWHYKGKDSILSVLRNAGFSYWCNDKNEHMGLIYAVNMRV